MYGSGAVVLDYGSGSGRQFNRGTSGSATLFIPDPVFFPSRLSDPDPTTTKTEKIKLIVLMIFCSHKFNKTVNCLINEQEQWNRNRSVNLLTTILIEVFLTHKIVTLLSENIGWIWD
jgi:hypothetical protein